MPSPGTPQGDAWFKSSSRKIEHPSRLRRIAGNVFPVIESVSEVSVPEVLATYNPISGLRSTPVTQPIVENLWDPLIDQITPDIPLSEGLQTWLPTTDKGTLDFTGKSFDPSPETREILAQGIINLLPGGEPSNVLDTIEQLSREYTPYTPGVGFEEDTVRGQLGQRDLLSSFALELFNPIDWAAGKGLGAAWRAIRGGRAADRAADIAEEVISPPRFNTQTGIPLDFTDRQNALYRELMRPASALERPPVTWREPQEIPEVIETTIPKIRYGPRWQSETEIARELAAQRRADEVAQQLYGTKSALAVDPAEDTATANVFEDFVPQYSRLWDEFAPPGSRYDPIIGAPRQLSGMQDIPVEEIPEIFGRMGDFISPSDLARAQARAQAIARQEAGPQIRKGRFWDDAPETPEIPSAGVFGEEYMPIDPRTFISRPYGETGRGIPSSLQQARLRALEGTLSDPDALADAGLSSISTNVPESVIRQVQEGIPSRVTSSIWDDFIPEELRTTEIGDSISPSDLARAQAMARQSDIWARASGRYGGTDEEQLRRLGYDIPSREGVETRYGPLWRDDQTYLDPRYQVSDGEGIQKGPLWRSEDTAAQMLLDLRAEDAALKAKVDFETAEALRLDILESAEDERFYNQLLKDQRDISSQRWQEAQRAERAERAGIQLPEETQYGPLWQEREYFEQGGIFPEIGAERYRTSPLTMGPAGGKTQYGPLWKDDQRYQASDRDMFERAEEAGRNFNPIIGDITVREPTTAEKMEAFKIKSQEARKLFLDKEMEKPNYNRLWTERADDIPIDRPIETLDRSKDVIKFRRGSVDEAVYNDEVNPGLGHTTANEKAFNQSVEDLMGEHVHSSDKQRAILNKYGTEKDRKVSLKRGIKEAVGRILVTRFVANLRRLENEYIFIVKDAEKKLNTAGYSKTTGAGINTRESIKENKLDDMNTLYRALHNEIERRELPENLKPIFDDLRKLTDEETAAWGEIDLTGINALDAFGGGDQYFYRGWKPSPGRTLEDLQEQTISIIQRKTGTVGVQPSALRPRNKLSYSEMREIGWEPLDWNPYRQYLHSKLQNLRFRHQITMRENLLQSGIAIENIKGRDVDSYIKEYMSEGMSREAATEKANKTVAELIVQNDHMTKIDYKVPEIGPAWDGKGSRSYPVLVPADIAKRLENLYKPVRLEGKVPIPLTGKSITAENAIDWLTFVPKRAKLMLSIFQQRDFIMRGLYGDWANLVDSVWELRREVDGASPEDIRKARKEFARSLKGAVSFRTLRKGIWANLSPQSRENLARRLISNEAVNDAFPQITWKMLVDSGLSTIDPTILAGTVGRPTDYGDVARTVAGDLGLLGGTTEQAKRVGRMVKSIEDSMRAGLFEGMYPAAIMTDVENNILPMIMRKHPNSSPESIAAMVTEIANVKYSTIPVEQSLIQGRKARYLLTRLFFSMGESEGLLRQAFGVLPNFKGLTTEIGGTPDYWLKHWAGTLLSTALIANIIHFASTGEPLPAERYIPTKRAYGGDGVFGWRPVYSGSFLAPTVPVEGRNDVEMTTDLMGQMDTALRVLDGFSFFQSRVSVPIRAGINQFQGSDFFGAPIDEVGPGGIYSRTARLISDLFTPIGLGELVEAGIEFGGVEAGASRETMQDLIGGPDPRTGGAGVALSPFLDLRARSTDRLMNDSVEILYGDILRNKGIIDKDETLSYDNDDLEPFLKTRARESEPIASELEAREEQGDRLEYESSVYFKELRNIDNEWKSQLRTLQNSLETGIMEGRFTSERMVINKYYELMNAKFQREWQHRKVAPEFEVKETDNPDNKALNEYNALIDEARYKDEEGNLRSDVNSDLLQKLREEFLVDLMRANPESVDYIKRNSNMDAEFIMEEFPEIFYLLPARTKQNLTESATLRNNYLANNE